MKSVGATPQDFQENRLHLSPSQKKWMNDDLQGRSRWWFQRFFIFTPTWGRFPIWLYNIFQMGWNHQLGDSFCQILQKRSSFGTSEPR